MSTKIDQFGRVIIPKELRESLGLFSGSELNIEVIENKVIITHQEEIPILKRKGAVLVYTGRALEKIGQNIVEKHRGERIQSFMKLK